VVPTAPLTEALARIDRNLDLYRVNGNPPIATTDAATLAPLIAAVIIVATAACLVPARQAARIDPIVALRHE
jgi:ABC-type lipoprotein release transport system permease subunit